MGWVRVSDDFYDHHKFNESGPLGVALWLAGMAYCNRNLTDGFLPRSKTRGLLDFDGIYLEGPGNELMGSLIDNLDEYTAAALTVVGLWHEDGHDCPVCPQPGPRMYYVHDYLEYQPSKSSVEETRAVRAEAGRKGGQAKQRAKQVATPPAKQSAKQTVKQNPGKNLPQSQVPIPSPIPSPNPQLTTSENQSVMQVVAQNDGDLTSVARFLKFDATAVRAELAAVVPDVTDEDVARVATHVLSKASGNVRSPTRYLIAAIQNDEYHIENITYGFEETA